MKKINVLILISLSVFTILSSCKKKEVVGPEGPQGLQGPQGSPGTNYNGTGKITGSLKFFTETGSQLIANQTATVFIPGTTFSTSPNSIGSYTLSNVPTGVYNVFVKCNTFGAVNLTNISVGTGVTSAQTMGLVKTPTWTITSLSIVTYTNGAYGVNVSENLNTTFYRASRIFYSDNASINATDPYSYKFVNAATLIPNATSSNPTYQGADLHAAGFTQGQTIYFKGYASAGFFNTVQLPELSQVSFSYTDTLTNVMLYNGLNLMGAVTNTFICP